MGLFTPFANLARRVIVPSVVFDVDAQNFFTATSITNSGLQIAVNNLVLDLKSASLWTPMNLIYPFVGDNMATLGTQLSFNLKDTGSFQATLVNGSGSSDFGGYNSNAAASRYIDTTYIPRTTNGVNGDFHASIYTTTDAETTDVQDLGAFSASTNVTILLVGRNRVGTSATKIAQLGGNVFAEANNSDNLGYFAASYVNAINPKTRLLRNGTQIASQNNTMNGNSNTRLFFGAVNVFNTSANNRTTKKYQFLTIGGGLSNAQMASLNTIVQTFQSAVDTAMGTSRRVL